MAQMGPMPELQLRQELRSRFPEINGSTVVKVMKMYNNDTEKCIQHLEHESQRSLFASPPNSNNNTNNNSNSPFLPASSHPSNNFNHSPNSNNSGHQGGLVGNFSSPAAMPRYQEVPVKHETTHISTVQHTVGPPALPPKPAPATTEVSTFAHPTMPPMQPPPRHVYPPRVPHTAPVRPNDFSPFLDSSPRKATDIPNIQCGPMSYGAAGTGSPESRRPVRVMHVHNYSSGGTVTSGTTMSPTGANPRFRVILGDGGGVCLPASSAPVTSPTSNPYRFASPAYVPTQPSLVRGQQETQLPGTHSSSIYIDTKNPRRTSVQESGDPVQSMHPNQYTFRASSLGPQSQGSGPVSLPPSRTMQPLTVSLSSHATNQGPSRGDGVVSVAGFTFNTSYGPAYSPSSSQYPHGTYYLNNGGSRYAQEGASPSPPRSSYPMVSMSQLTITPGMGAGGASFPTSHSPGSIGIEINTPGYGAVSPVLLPKSPRLQHQRSTGSSTSRSNSMDSEHGSVHYPSDSPGEVTHLPHPLRGKSIVGIGVGGGMPIISPASSQSSINSDTSAHSSRQRSGSMQEEAAYSQALLHHQQLRMDKLKEDIENKRQLLNRLREQVSDAEKSKIEKKSLRTTFPTADDIAGLCESNRLLQTDIQMYLNEIDMYKNGQTPFTVLDPMGQQNFFNNMPTGPNDLFRPQHSPHRSPPPPPPPRPPPPRLPPPLQRFNSNDLSQTVPAPTPGQTVGGGSGDSEEGERWACSACTFENHPALKKCEMCEMPRMMAGS